MNPIAVGTRVYYVPHECHAREKDAAGETPWIMGAKTQKVGRSGQVQEHVVPLEGKALDEHYTKPRNTRAPLVPLRPRMLWVALVSRVASDGTVGLDIQAAQSGVTLHYDGIALDPMRTSHTCYPVGDEPLEPDTEALFRKLERNFSPAASAATPPVA